MAGTLEWRSDLGQMNVSIGIAEASLRNASQIPNEFAPRPTQAHHVLGVLKRRKNMNDK